MNLFKKSSQSDKNALQTSAIPGEKQWHVIHPVILRLLISLGILAVVAGMVYWKRSALRRFENEWSADRHLAKAVEELEKGAPDVALRRALTSIQLKPNRIETLRVLMTAARAVGDGRILTIAQALYTHEAATPEDRIEALGAINDVGDTLRFPAFWEALSGEARALPEAQVERMRHLLLKKAPLQVIEELGKSELAPGDPRRLMKIHALLQFGEAEKDRAALTLALEEAREAPDEEARRKIFGLISVLPPERIPREIAAEALEAARSFPAIDELEPTLNFTLRIAQAPESRQGIAREALAALQKEHLDSLCRWLMRLREHRLIIEHIDEVQAFRSGFAFEARVQSLIAVHRLEDAFILLQFPPETADRVGALMLKATVARALGRKSEETAAWQEALLEAERDMTQNNYLKLARFAQAAGERRVAADAIVAACRHPRGIMPPSGEIDWLMQYLIENDRPGDLLVVSRRFLRSEWGNPVLLNNAIYLSVILGGEDSVGENVIQLVDSLQERHPGILGIRTTKALVHLLAGRAEEARGVFRPEEFTGIGWQAFPAPDRAVFALVLRETGPEALALNVRDRIDWDDMLEVERAFFWNRLFPGSRILPEAESSPGDAAAAATEPAGEGEEKKAEAETISPRAQALLLRQEAEKAAEEGHELSPRMKILQEQQKAREQAAEEEAAEESGTKAEPSANVPK